jgi:hypothetical protein
LRSAESGGCVDTNPASFNWPAKDLRALDGSSRSTNDRRPRCSVRDAGFNPDQREEVIEGYWLDGLADGRRASLRNAAKEELDLDPEALDQPVPFSGYF